MTMATGGQRWAMATSGFPASLSDGLRITTATGLGSIRGDGPGSTMHPGAMLRSTMAAGRHSLAGGDGFPDRWK